MMINHLPAQILVHLYGLGVVLNFERSFLGLTERHRPARFGTPNSVVWYYKYHLLSVGCAIGTYNMQIARRAEYDIFDCIS